MKFRFKRKYTSSFLIFVFLIALVVGFYFIAPKYIDRDTDFFNQVLFISIVDVILISIFIFGSYKVNYYLFHDHLEIRRSLLKPIKLQYNQIKEFTEFPNDSVIFIFGKRPSFRVKYQQNGKTKKYRIRLEKHDLFKLVMENEKKINISKNK